MPNLLHFDGYFSYLGGHFTLISGSIWYEVGVMSTSDSTSLKIQIDSELRRKLDAVTTKNEHSLAEEIRSRLNYSFELDADANLSVLVDSLVRLAKATASELGGAWHATARGRAMLSAAITDQIVHHRVEGVSLDQSELTPSEAQEAAIAGRTIARMVRNNPSLYASKRMPGGWTILQYSIPEAASKPPKADKRRKK